MIAQGEMAPDFTAYDSDQQPVHLAAHRGRERVILYFFPKCFTPGCDIEAGKFRDEFPRFQGARTRVFGISRDDPETARKYREDFHLPFPVIPDPEGKIIGLFGVDSGKGYARRVTFLIGLDGRIEVVVDDRSPELHITRTLEHLRAP